MRDVPMPNEMSVIFPDRSAKEVFEETCLNWPHNSHRDTGDCCWQWVDGD